MESFSHHVRLRCPSWHYRFHHVAAAESSKSSSQILEVVEVPACLDAIASADSQRNLRVKLKLLKNIF